MISACMASIFRRGIQQESRPFTTLLEEGEKIDDIGAEPFGGQFKEVLVLVLGSKRG